MAERIVRATSSLFLIPVSIFWHFSSSNFGFYLTFVGRWVSDGRERKTFRSVCIESYWTTKISINHISCDLNNGQVRSTCQNWLVSWSETYSQQSKIFIIHMYQISVTHKRMNIEFAHWKTTAVVVKTVFLARDNYPSFTLSFRVSCYKLRQILCFMEHPTEDDWFRLKLSKGWN